MLHVHQITIRREEPGDEAAIGRVHDEAFGQPVESRIVDAVRRAGLSAISLVAVDGPQIVGHILFTPVSIEGDGPVIDALGLGPMAVSPGLQRRGIGSKLVESGLRQCVQAGCEVVVVVGHPQFYPRFGFRPGSSYGLRLAFEVPDEVFLVLEMKAGVLARRSGLVRYIPQFEA
jgi:putative acetyltransferase